MIHLDEFEENHKFANDASFRMKEGILRPVRRPDHHLRCIYEKACICLSAALPVCPRFWPSHPRFIPVVSAIKFGTSVHCIQSSMVDGWMDGCSKALFRGTCQTFRAQAAITYSFRYHFPTF